MGGVGSGGHNVPSAAAHLALGTWRSDRHSPPTAIQEPLPGPPRSLSVPATSHYLRLRRALNGRPTRATCPREALRIAKEEDPGAARVYDAL
jgi:hypothetical protein